MQRDFITNTTYGLHYYDSVLVVEKATIPEPIALITGMPSFVVSTQEYLALADHDYRKGKLQAAIEKCRAALLAKPDAEQAKAMLQALLEKQAASTA